MHNNKINKLLSEKMTRKKFLKYSGLGILTLIGITGLGKKVEDLNNLSNHKSTEGFGSGSYGGKG